MSMCKVISAGILLAAGSVLWIAPSVAQDAAVATDVIELDQTVISGNQELPKVLYILPWQSPEGLPDLQVKADFTEAEVFRRLYPPAYRRELKYFETLNRTESQE